jgi:membrane-bound lytic murein transglycosylase B
MRCTRSPSAYPRYQRAAKIPRENLREAFFRDELGQLFALGKDERFDITALQGSYAGAMGWGQFMPSSYRDYAVDGDGDGKRDLFKDLDDVFASVANYFAKKGGWQRGAPVMLRATAMRAPPNSTPRRWSRAIRRRTRGARYRPNAALRRTRRRP